MGQAPAILQSNIESNAIDVTPASDAPAGVAFFDPISGYYVIASRDIGSGQLGAASNSGHYRLKKEDPTAVITSGSNLAFGTTGYVAGTDPLVALRDSESGDRFVIAELNPESEGGGAVTSSVTYSKMTSTEVDGTIPVDTDWPGGNPPLNGLLEVERLPLERDHREFYVWGGVAFAKIDENLKVITAVTHGLDLTTQEGQRVPVAWFYDGVTSRPPTTIEEVNHFAVRAPDANTLVLRVATDMADRTYSGCTNALGALGETIYWSAASNTHTQATNPLRLFQVSDTDLELIKWGMEDTRTSIVTADQTLVVDEWVSFRITGLAQGVEILNAEFFPQGTTTGDPPLLQWNADPAIEISAGGVPVLRFNFNDPDCTGTVTATGISFNRDLYANDQVVVRQYRVV